MGLNHRLSLLGALALLHAGCGERCEMVRQTVYIEMLDATLAGLVEQCAPPVDDVRFLEPFTPVDASVPFDAGAASDAGVGDAGPPLTTRAQTLSGVDRCVPVCERVLALVDTFPGRHPLLECTVRQERTATGTFLRVSIGYRPPC